MVRTRFWATTSFLALVVATPSIAQAAGPVQQAPAPTDQQGTDGQAGATDAPAAASVRVAYRYRSNFATDFTAGGLFNAEYTKTVSRLDASASLDILKNLTITADATNLLFKPFQDYFGGPQYPRGVRYEARTNSLGARFRF